MRLPGFLDDGLAHDLELKVIAEGVEDKACLAFHRSVVCDYAHGYYDRKPMPLANLQTPYRKSPLGRHEQKHDLMGSGRPSRRSSIDV